MMSNMKEYIVTVQNRDDLEDFYVDMETEGGTLYIPGRIVECSLRRPISRNTHYMLTDEEAELLKNDPRVISVELHPEERGLHVRRLWIQTETTWNKSSTNTSTHKNWGLLRCVEGVQRSNWGSNGTTSQTGTIQVNVEGKHVDVVIVDGMIDPSHPEFAINSDGTGGTRVIQYNWFQHDVGDGTGTYVYTPYSGTGAQDDNNHGAHVAGTVAGNTQGWARKANIYNINPYSTDVNNTDPFLLIDYIRAFHNNKSVNPSTGRKNPTICNHSWGYGYNPVAISSITNVRYRGVTYNGPFSAATLNGYGIFTATVSSVVSALAPARVTALDADIQDAIDDGIIMVAAASNDYMKVDVVGGLDYDNYWVAGGFQYPYHRGSSPGAASNTICVGAVGSLVSERKATFSNCGPRVDIYAPGANIMSSLNAITTNWPGANDPRNSSYKIGKAQGTSMASPQVCGVLACVLEIYPSMTQIAAKQYIQNYSKSNQVDDTGGGYTDYTSLQGSGNRYLFYYKERKDSGNTWPKLNYSIRSATKAVYPRTRIRRTI